jgi:multiple sugar transport system permease protein
MSGAQQVLAFGGPAAVSHGWRPGWRGRLRGSDRIWAIAFLVPYIVVFLAFVTYPAAYGLWLGSSPGLYADLFDNPLYLTTVINTLLFVGIGVNVMMFAAFLLSGYFLGRSPWVKVLLVLFMLPWALPAIPAFLAVHWMLVGQYGFLNSLLSVLFDIDGPIWLNSHWLAVGANITASIWKWLPFWTLVFIAGRMAIPDDIYEAADVDGATEMQRFAYITVPVLANLYLICTLLSTLWTIGDFSAVFFVSGGAPALQSEVLATLGMHLAFDSANPRLGIAAMMSALPLLIPLTILLMRRVHVTQVQL